MLFLLLINFLLQPPHLFIKTSISLQNIQFFPLIFVLWIHHLYLLTQISIYSVQIHYTIFCFCTLIYATYWFSFGFQLSNLFLLLVYIILHIFELSVTILQFFTVHLWDSMWKVVFLFLSFFFWFVNCLLH